MRKATYFPLSWQQQPRKITPQMEKRLLAQREAWVRQIAPTDLFHNLFDLIPGTYFFAKNRRGQIMFTCAASRRLYRINKETESIGITDFDINPPDMAESYVHDDARIYATGEPVLNRVELWFDEQGMPDWFVVNKIPIRSRGGKIVGIMGFSQSYEGRARLLAPFAGISKAVAHIRKNYQLEISIKELARASGLSQRQLERKFQAAFAVSPQDFLIKTRLLAASRLLRESDESLVQIAFDCGFTDQSAFSLHFRRHFGITPRDFRGQSHLGRPK